MPLEIGRTQRPLFSPVLWFVVLLMGGYLLVSLAPDDPARLPPLVVTAVDTLASWIPSIDKWAGYSEFPARTRLLFSYLWLTSPVFCWVVFRWKKYEMDFVGVWIKSPQKNGARTVLLVFLVIVIVYVDLKYAFRDAPPCIICVNSSVWSQTVIGTSMIYSGSGCIAVLLWLIRNRRKIYKYRG